MNESAEQTRRKAQMAGDRAGARWSKTMDAIRRALIDSDPIHIVFEDIENFDEYDSEAREIAALLDIAPSMEDLTDQIWMVFVRKFSKDVAGRRDRFQSLATRIWSLRH